MTSKYEPQQQQEPREPSSRGRASAPGTVLVLIERKFTVRVSNNLGKRRVFMSSSYNLFIYLPWHVDIYQASSEMYGLRVLLQIIIALVLASATASFACHKVYQIRGNDRWSSATTLWSSQTNHHKQRKRHLNKYGQYSKHQVDPLEEAIERTEAASIRDNLDFSTPVRGTTIPTQLGSPSIQRNSSFATQNFPSFDKIVPSDPSTFGFVHIGNILGPHGVKGDMKVELNSDFIDEKLVVGKLVFVKRPNRRSPRPVRLGAIRKLIKNLYLLKFDCIRSRLGAGAFKGYSIFVKDQDRSQLPFGEYYIRDLVGAECFLYSDYSDVQRRDTLVKPVAEVAGVVLPDDLCSNAELAHLMHAQLELRKLGDDTNLNEMCLVPLVPSIVPVVELPGQWQSGAHSGLENAEGTAETSHGAAVSSTRAINKGTQRCRIFIDPPAGLLDLTYRPIQRKVIIRGYLPSHIDC